MHFEFSEDQKIFREAVREFLAKELQPLWDKIDEEHWIPTELIHKMGEQGLFAIPVPEEYGGQGGDFTSAAIAVEEIAYHDPSVAVAVFTLLNNAWPYILYLYGNEEVKSEILPLVGRGRGFFGIASTEPHGGSDVAGTRTRAVKKGDSYVVNGEKIFISGVREAMKQLELGSWYLITRTGPDEAKHKGISAFAFIGNKNGEVPEGFEYSILNTIGRHGISTGMLTFKDVEVPGKYLIGEENRGFYYAMEGFTLARILVAAANIGASRWALERMVEWARGRELFGGRPISSFQGVSFPIAEIAMELEAARLLVYEAAWMADRIYIKKEPGLKPKDLSFYSASAKLKAVKTGFKAFETLMVTYGANSYVKETNVARGFLGVLSYLVGAEGAQNIMRYIIAREVIGREYIKG
ncbi:MAG: acyl-CoA/acyl-ACP dehydrogenase [Desulfurococcales archaeon]|nr:acyl-CoA/acyl-ACP dehydrogenase [Desulfurococcales archaeon]MCE4622191.1 acyl-CoA/acyl-ACP dehydrogenase [Desulfurococcales archaeon]MCE4626450.1 acyl-CoA/acyl-ACP dehydrogenase [Desulfurococcales archaeon]MCE4628738.1 acyl-CoA/acyl-ACP dehydrogenase [Desulfurococcales archaeon]